MATDDRGLQDTQPWAFRADIQALRGLAVLLVLFYHSGLNWVRAGYLGVDIFFVVSGFLITRIIARDVDAGRFRYKDFYYHRARRILPAAFAMLLLTTIAAAGVLTTSQLVDFRDQVVSSVLFVSNMMLWSQTGYFSREAWQQPLLHMWSLAIEEQYYILMPIAMMLLRARVRNGVIALATCLSLVLCLAFVWQNPAATFFFLPTRGWELGIGSLAAIAAGQARIRQLASRLLWPAAIIVLLIPIVPSDLPHPSLAALSVCVATATIILARSARLSNSALIRPLAKVGDFSYSLYLVHWPLFALTRVLYMERDLPMGVIGSLMLASLGAGYLMYRVVETPLRATPPDQARRLIGGLAVAAAVLVILPVVLVEFRPRPDQRVLAQVMGFKGCLKEGAPEVAVGCGQSRAPEILVWGDSYAAHIIPGLDATTSRPIEQQTRAMCGPMADFTERAGMAEQTKAHRCLTWNAAILRYLVAKPSVQVVVLAARYDRFLNPEADIVSSAGAAQIPQARRSAAAADAILDTARRLRALGKRVVVIAPPPMASYDQGLCWERKSQHLPRLGRFADCRLRPDLHAVLEAPTIAMLAHVQRRGVPVVFLAQGMCRTGQCVSEWNGRPLYRDAGHLTALGSLFAAKSNDLGRAVWERAR
ncbi:Peptidoglycan/LPS O-acetylase OafA/YrhL, contains acyltransferase and SGNH-hydrolase domains [Novosphingobium sp. CF614]|uniref:acyltransferase family protein n=1 Tax=Novosphingobium sp. CF614 TaxID=1884364 RepID=UPI0008EE8FBE|nr:acyltransferase family protein [Novosphingobium sp. CF614]SFG20799.1 Peptidoglycan/LPS O-acetylase OafA/YrhL, contains acyltransferase and SGNH-hydrolase domains [Novosphingobium sp. CF614]